MLLLLNAGADPEGGRPAQLRRELIGPLFAAVDGLGRGKASRPTAIPASTGRDALPLEAATRHRHMFSIRSLNRRSGSSKGAAEILLQTDRGRRRGWSVSPRNPWPRPEHRNPRGRFCCKFPADAANRSLRTQLTVVSIPARKARAGSDRRLRAGRVLDAFLGEAVLRRAVQLLFLRGGVAGRLGVLLAFCHEARQGGARELLLGRGRLAARPRRQRRHRVERQRNTDRDRPHDSASLAVSPPHCKTAAQYPIRLSISCSSPPPFSILRMLAAISVTSC